ncbi:hypothetical protein [Paracoccus siganidrum]|uniref:hypothetical protein n=1 Tax=Paracoccus siganidrum TaxID=1276757 RepID=UPI001472F4FC|nr:hypothetical protein [Paracoccus siganidrum]
MGLIDGGRNWSRFRHDPHGPGLCHDLDYRARIFCARRPDKPAGLRLGHHCTARTHHPSPSLQTGHGTPRRISVSVMSKSQPAS